MEKAMNCNVPETEDLENLTDLIADMMQNGHSLSPQTIENIFEKLIQTPNSSFYEWKYSL